ncbi:YidH family protein [Thermodesulfobium sp.]|uniref:DUF202 domain-containing protein n=1 Tax=Thermodesulfobium narugense TaxID=184064 RepID=A0A7C5PFZ0_9BACT
MIDLLRKILRLEEDRMSYVDPRFAMAAVRTFLAWVRTAFNMLGFGIALDKVDVWLQTQPGISSYIRGTVGSIHIIVILLLVMAVCTILAGAIDYVQNVKKIRAGYFQCSPEYHIGYMSFVVAVLLVLVLFVLIRA